MTEARILGGRYRLTGHLARGGMADVFRAEDQLLGRKVAVKILHPQFARDEAFVARFRREAQAAANLSHPNIVSIYDWGEQGAVYYMVMELIEGRTLRDIIRSEGALLPRRAAEIAAEAAAALSVAHQAGVYHRDIKPGNIMLTPDGSVKVTDFGIARALDDSEELTKTGAVIGTATYFSPEQAQGLPADERSDVYSLGVVLYELVSGTAPFSGESPVSVAYQHVSEYAAPPSAVLDDVPAELDAVVMRAMEKRPGDRYQTALEMRNDLLRFLRGEPLAPAADAAVAQTRMMAAPPPATVTPDETARHVAYTADDDRGQGWYIFGIVSLLALLAVGIFILTNLLSSGDEEAATDNVVIPSLAGVAEEEAFSRLQDLDLKVQKRNEASESVPAGIVIRTDPVEGTEVQAATFVTVYVSSGPELFPVLNLIGDDEATARSRIEANRLVVGGVTYQPSEDSPEGVVLRQSPEAGVMVAPGTRVDIEISSGPFALTLPDVTGLTEVNATRALTVAGFTDIEVLEEYSADVITGFVIETQPPPLSLVPRGTAVQLVISLGPPPVAVPDLTGLTVNEAQQQLQTLGIVLLIDSATVPVPLDSGLDGLVATQEPAVGAEVPEGGSVRVGLGAAPRVAVPNVVGLTEADARQALQSRGLVMEVGDPVQDAAQVGNVVTQSVNAGTQVLENTVVVVQIGVAPPTTTTTTTTSTTTTSTTTTTAP